MADPFVAEIRIFTGDFAPRGWALCNGQLLPLSQNTALFSLLGTTYGGDGKSTFGLPDLQGSMPLGWGQGPGLSVRDLGELGGSDTVTLIETEMPSHTHQASAVASAGTATAPGSTVVWAQPRYGRASEPAYTAYANATTTMHAQALAPAGGGQPHNNLPPYLTLNFIIALQGVFPQRS